MSADALAYVLGALVALFSGVYATRATQKAAKQTKAASEAIEANRVQVEKVRADGEAYDRAEGINRRMVDDLTAEVSRLRRELGELREQLRSEERTSAELENRVRNLQSTVDRLSNLLRQHDIPLPS